MNITAEVTHAFPDMTVMHSHAPYAWYVIFQGHEEDKSKFRIARRTFAWECMAYRVNNGKARVHDS